MDQLKTASLFIHDLGFEGTLGVNQTADAATKLSAERHGVIQRTLNKKILVPDIMKLMPAWPSEIQPDVDEINLEIDEWLKT